MTEAPYASDAILSQHRAALAQAPEHCVVQCKGAKETHFTQLQHASESEVITSPTG